VKDGQNGFDNNRLEFPVTLRTDCLVSSLQQRDRARSKLRITDDSGGQVRGEFISLGGKAGPLELGNSNLREICEAIRQ